MPAPYSSSQKAAISQFVGFTQARESIAAKFLKPHGWNVEQAVDAYYQSNASASNTGKPATAINKIFDEYRVLADDEPDVMGVDGAIKYFGAINVALDEVNCIAIAELLKCTTMGEFSRASFVEGWRSVNCDTLAKQAEYAKNLRDTVKTDRSLFKRVYRHGFQISRVNGQRSISIETALELWKMFFDPAKGGVPWTSPDTRWLDLWLGFVEKNHKRPINKDLWEQVEVFSKQSMADPGLSFWSADGAWPGAIDDFVLSIKESKG